MKINELLKELGYSGNVGVMELVKFFEKATPPQVHLFKSAMDSKMPKKAWQIVQKVTGAKLQGSEFREGVTMKKSKLKEIIREEIRRIVSEAKDETDVQKRKPMPTGRGYNRASWEWRIHSKGSYWQSRGKGGPDIYGDWGARALSGEVDHFKDRQQAMKFAGHTHKGKDARDLYRRGSFK